MKKFSCNYKITSLEIIAFVSGAVVMILELIGSRILAPHLGTSIFVWSSLIGIILGALSLGYYLGGRFSKIKPSLSSLTQILMLAGIAILFIPSLKEPVLSMAMKLGVKNGSIIATLSLFTIPSILLGMVSPYVIRLKIKNVENSGGVAGNLYAISTIGSICGTFLAGFYLIPHFGSIKVIFALGLILILLSLLGGKKILKILLLIIIIFSWVINQNIPSKNLYEADTAYNHITIRQHLSHGEKIRVLSLSGSMNSCLNLDDEDNFCFEYHKFYLLDNLFKNDIKKALTLGGGAYIMPINFLKRYPDAKMTVIEIDPALTKIAKDYFNLKDSARLKIHYQDARIFLNNNKEKYDAVYGDAFSSDHSVPFQLTTKEAISKINESLVKDGIFVLNFISALEGKGSRFFQAQYATLAETFPQIYIFPNRYLEKKDFEKYQNIIIIASKNSIRLSFDKLMQNASESQKEALGNLLEESIAIDSGTKILTDDFAPVDYYISKIF